MAQKEQLAVSYASFVLSAQGAQINDANINAVLKAANVNAPNVLVSAVAKALKGRSVTQFFGGVGGSSESSDAPAPKTQKKQTAKEAPKPAGKPAAKETAPPPPPAEEQQMDVGGLFD